MIATTKADFYRLFRTKGFWISQFIIIGIIFISIASQSVGQVGVSLGESAKKIDSQFSIQWTGVVSVVGVTSMMAIFLYTMLPMMVIIIGHDFSSKTYKNILTVGVSRTKYFLSQYISFTFMIFLQVFYIYAASFLAGTLFYGVGDGFNNKIVMDWLFVGMIQFLMIMAILTVSCFVTYLTKNSVLAILSAIFLPLILSLISYLYKDMKWINSFNFLDILGDTKFLLSKSSEVYQSTFAALGTIIVFLLITIVQFNKSEL